MPKVRLKSVFLSKTERDVLTRISRFSDEKSAQLVRLLKDVNYMGDTAKERIKFSEKVVKEIKDLTLEEAGIFFNICHEILSEQSSDVFDEDVARDSLPEEGIDEKDIQRLLNLFREIHKDSQYFTRRKIEAYKDTGPELIRSFDWAVDLRGVFKKGFRYAENNVVDYDPELDRVIPMVLLEFQAGPFQEKISFQIDEYTLDRMINELLAAQKQLLKLKEKLMETKQ